MSASRRRLMAGGLAAITTVWGAWAVPSPWHARPDGQLALLKEDSTPPVVDLGYIVANDTPGRAAATVPLALDLRDGETRKATRLVRPFSRKSDQAYVELRFPDRTVAKVAESTPRFWVTDCRRLGILPPVPVGCAGEATPAAGER